LKHTISSAEFHHQLQSGQIQAALSLISSDSTLLERGFTQELDVTTHLISDDLNVDRAVNNGYLRTKINLFTGEVHNEVSQSLVLDRASYTNLQQLHMERIETSYRIVREHRDRIEAILSALSPAEVSDAASAQQISVGMGDLAATLHQHRLTRSRSMSPATNGIADRQERVTTIDELATPLDRLFQSEESLAECLTAATHESLASMPAELEFDERDLAIPADDEIWEEWVEDDDFQPESIAPQPTQVLEELKLPDFQEHWVRRPLNPIDVKPIVPRSTTISSDPIERWEKFVPEYIEIEDRHLDRSPPERVLANRVSDTLDREQHGISQPDHDREVSASQ
jgi:hypothetical protein